MNLHFSLSHDMIGLIPNSDPSVHSKKPGTCNCFSSKPWVFEPIVPSFLPTSSSAEMPGKQVSQATFDAIVREAIETSGCPRRRPSLMQKSNFAQSA